MARRRGGGDGESGGSWLDTYADMITLILCFFVLLYSMSTMDEAKFQYIAQAFSSMGKIINAVVAEQVDVLDPTGNLLEDPELNASQVAETPETFDQLYQFLSQFIADNDLSASIELEKGAAGITLKFRDNIFFEPDSATLQPSGRKVLEGIAPAFKSVDHLILGIKVSGHTARAPASPVDEWTLSSDRANNVVRYMMELDFISPDKLSSSGYGGYRPVDTNDTPEGRRNNRRVEITIARNDVDYSNPAVIQEFLDMEYGKNKVNVAPIDALGNVIYTGNENPSETESEENLPEETTGEETEITDETTENPEETTDTE